MLIEQEHSISKLAGIVNDLEEVQLEEEFTPFLDRQIKTWVDTLNRDASKLATYAHEIGECLIGVANFYRIHNASPPKFSEIYQI